MPLGSYLAEATSRFLLPNTVNHATYEDKDAPMRDMTLKQWNNTLNTNLTSTFLVIRAFLRQLDGQSEEAKRNVSVVLIGSTAGKYGEAGKFSSLRFAALAHGYIELVLISYTCFMVISYRSCRLCRIKVRYDGWHHALTEE